MADTQDIKPSTPKKTRSSSQTANMSSRASPSSPHKAKAAQAWSAEEDYMIMTYLATTGAKQLTADQREELASILGRTERGVQNRLKKMREDMASMASAIAAKKNAK